MIAEHEDPAAENVADLLTLWKRLKEEHDAAGRDAAASIAAETEARLRMGALETPMLALARRAAAAPARDDEDLIAKLELLRLLHEAEEDAGRSTTEVVAASLVSSVAEALVARRSGP
ncbi:MAG: hypothetical protein AAF192_20955 [Pseudomonadota bacterium]